MTLKNGKPCTQCGTSDWYKHGNCKYCQGESNNRWRENNPEYGQRYRQKNKHRLDESKKEYYEKNKSELKDRQKKYNRKRRQDPRYRQRENESWKKWCQENKDKIQARAQRRRAVKNGVKSEPYSFEKICEKYGNKCLACGKKRKLTIDHIIPISEGGPDIESNIQPLCRSCNSSKSTKTIDYR